MLAGDVLSLEGDGAVARRPRRQRRRLGPFAVSDRRLRDPDAPGEGRAEHARRVEAALDRKPILPAWIQGRDPRARQRIELTPVRAHVEVGESLLVAGEQ